MGDYMQKSSDDGKKRGSQDKPSLQWKGKFGARPPRPDAGKQAEQQKMIEEFLAKKTKEDVPAEPTAESGSNAANESGAPTPPKKPRKSASQQARDQKLISKLLEIHG